ncbi:MAG: hypothetical protein IKN96_03885, partial [Oscillibacter sp.]|nr:hypothetical protein [Oscillibacter sp.]
VGATGIISDTVRDALDNPETEADSDASDRREPETVWDSPDDTQAVSGRSDSATDDGDIQAAATDITANIIWDDGAEESAPAAPAESAPQEAPKAKKPRSRRAVRFLTGFAAALRVREAVKESESADAGKSADGKPKRRKNPWIQGAIAAALALVILSGSVTYNTAFAASYVSIDVDESSVEFAVNRMGRVISVKPISSDAEGLAQSIESGVKNKKVDDAVSYAMDALKDAGYLNAANGEVIASVTSDTEKREMELTQTVAQSMDGHRQDGLKVYLMAAGKPDRQAALARKVSPGRYLIRRSGMESMPERNDDSDASAGQVSGNPATPAAPDLSAVDALPQAETATLANGQAGAAATSDSGANANASGAPVSAADGAAASAQSAAATDNGNTQAPAAPATPANDAGNTQSAATSATTPATRSNNKTTSSTRTNSKTSSNNKTATTAKSNTTTSKNNSKTTTTTTKPKETTPVTKPAAQPTPEPKSEPAPTVTQPESEPAPTEPESAPAQQPEPGSVPAPRQEPEPESRPVQQQPEPEPESRPVPQPEPEPESRPVPQPESRPAEPEPEQLWGGNRPEPQPNGGGQASGGDPGETTGHVVREEREPAREPTEPDDGETTAPKPANETPKQSEPEPVREAPRQPEPEPVRETPKPSAPEPEPEAVRPSNSGGESKPVSEAPKPSAPEPVKETPQQSEPVKETPRQSQPEPVRETPQPSAPEPEPEAARPSNGGGESQSAPPPAESPENEMPG